MSQTRITQIWGPEDTVALAAAAAEHPTVPARRQLPMRPRKLRRLLLAVGAGAVLAGTGVGWATEAHADELSYLQLLNQRGLVVWDTAQALRTGWALCDALNTYTGDIVGEAFYQVTDASVPDRATAGIWLLSAVEGLCPWHDHRNELRYAL